MNAQQRILVAIMSATAFVLILIAGILYFFGVRSQPDSSTTVIAEQPSAVQPSAEPTTTQSDAGNSSSTASTGVAWLDYTNQFRSQAGLPGLASDDRYIAGSVAHSRYMAQSGNISHSQDASHPAASEEGARAAENGNIYASIAGSTYEEALDYWIAAPFHGVPLLDPKLERIGYGDFTEGEAFRATLEYKTGVVSNVPAGVQYPITFPADGGQTWVTSQRLPEFPSAMDGCGYSFPAGAAVYALLGDGSNVPNVQSASISSNGQALETCQFNESDYNGGDGTTTGRLILDQRDAIVLIARQPLEVGQTYTAEVVYTLTDAGGAQSGPETLTWTFDVVSGP